MLGWIILFSIFGSVFSTIGGVFLLLREKLTNRISLFLISFAAGVLLGVSFLDVIPEAMENFSDPKDALLYVLAAIVFFFIVEKSFWWYHHHRFQSKEHRRETEHHTLNKTDAYLLLVGDSIHNFVDGIVIAAAFLVDFPLGVGVAVGVVAHELPQEIADFSIMLRAGFSRKKVLILNLITALTTLLGALLAYFSLGAISFFIPPVLAIAGGIFIYLALSDLIPAIHHTSEHKYDFVHFILFIAGIVLMAVL
ncbi:MAG: ZIP family metal transporter [Candidatus Spechtbacterales bacterium]